MNSVRLTHAQLPARRGSRGCQAFTLIEVVVSLAIAAISLAAATAAVNQMVDGARGMQERTYASWIAQNRIVELRLANVLPEASRSTDEVTFANQEWVLETVITETGIENLFRVDVNVSRQGSDEFSGIVTGFVGEPVVPGDANTVWSSSSQAAGETE